MPFRKKPAIIDKRLFAGTLKLWDRIIYLENIMMKKFWYFIVFILLFAGICTAAVSGLAEDDNWFDNWMHSKNDVHAYSYQLYNDNYLLYGEAIEFKCQNDLDGLDQLTVHAYLNQTEPPFYQEVPKIIRAEKLGKNNFKVTLPPGLYTYLEVVAVNDDGDEIASADIYSSMYTAVVRLKEDVMLIGCPDELLINQEYEPGLNGPSWKNGIVHYGDGASCSLNNCGSDMNNTTHPHSYTQTGSYEVWAIACLNGEWYGTKKKTVKVTSYGVMPDYTIDTDHWIWTDKDFDVRINGNDLSTWTFDVCFFTDDYGSFKTGPIYSDCAIKNGHILIPAKFLKENEIEGSIEISFFPVSKEGYDCYGKSQHKTVLFISLETMEKMKLIRLPKKTTKIGKQAFINCDFEIVIIPDGCTLIGSEAFANCKNLKYVYIPSSVTDIAADAFSGSDQVIINR